MTNTRQHAISGVVSDAVRAKLEEQLNDIFIRFAIENRGIMMSPHRAPQVTTRLIELATAYAAGAKNEPDISETAVHFAEQGMAYVTTARLILELRLLVDYAKVDFKRLNDFQFLFLEQFSNARELVQLRIQENSQIALQHALQQQIEQQRISNLAEVQRSENLSAVLALNSELSAYTSKNELATNAVIGLCKALDLIDVSLVERMDSFDEWQFLASSTSQSYENLKNIFIPILDRAIDKELDNFSEVALVNGDERLLIVDLFRLKDTVVGGLLIQAKQTMETPHDEVMLLIQTFGQNVFSLWKNIDLLEEMRARTKELEVYYGRFIDEIWSDENAQLEAHIKSGKIYSGIQNPDANSEHKLALRIGEHSIGEVLLPAEIELSEEDQKIVQSIVAEMSDALNNAQLIQKTRSYSNQLAVAASVSQAATTLLNHEELIESVVELVREQFGFYYVGLFLVDDLGKKAILQAGSGEAGRLQVERGHHHTIGGGSMIGAAIEDGRARVEQDVSKAKAFIRNELLPNTQSELALPLISREITIGALTVQSTEKNAFTRTTVTVLQSLANQLAIAIENAKLLAKTQTNLEETNHLYETARTIGAAQSDKEVFEALVTFAATSNLADVVHIITEDQDNPNHIKFPVLWSKTSINYDPGYVFPRNKYTFVERLANEEVVYVRQRDLDALDTYTKRLFDSYHIKSAVYLSLQGKEQWLGTVALLYHTRSLPTTQMLQPFLTLIDHATIILTNHHLLKQSNALYLIGRELNESLTRDSAIEIIVREIGKYTGASQCRFVIYDERSQSGELVASYHPVERSKKHFSLHEDPLLQKMKSDPSPQLITVKDTAFSQEVIEKHLLQYDATASYLIPCASQTELIGYLAVDSHEGKRPFKMSNLLFIQSLLSHLMTQIENIKLFDEALARAQELITLNQIQSNISKVIAVGPLAKTAFTEIGRLLKRDLYIFSLYDSEHKKITPVYVNYKNEELSLEPRVLKSSDPIREFLDEKKQRLTDQQDALTRSEAAYMNIPVPKSALWMPLLNNNDQCIGVLTIQSYINLAYVEDDQQLLRSIATQTSLALTNAQLFETIQAKNKALQQLDQLKTQFLANMSHELRTPLNSIIGFSRVILKGIDGPITSEQEEDLTSIHTNGQHLLTLINEILDMAKIGAGKMTLSFEQVDVYQAAKIATKTVRSLIDESRVRFIWDVPNHLPLIYADSVRLRQILINLLSNAAKYTQEGRIQLTIREEYGKQVHIIVSDTGIGIAEKDHNKLFTAFEQVDNSTTRTVGGTGLGLPITKWIVDMHHGEIWFESEANKGTTFHVTLPIKHQSPEKLTDGTSLSGKNLNLSS